MPRVGCGSARHRRKKRLFKAAEGYRNRRRVLYRTAKEALIRAGVYAYRDRRVRRRDFRRLWITRITAACRMRDLSYSRFIAGLKAANVILNRKVLSDVAITDPVAFDLIVEIAKKHVSSKHAA
jgi:large subunit ribosomal protein L20